MCFFYWQALIFIANLLTLRQKTQFMNQKIFFFLFLLVNTGFLFASEKQQAKMAGWRETDYSVECLGTGQEGTTFMRVYFYFKKDKDAGIFAKKHAVDAVLFRGIIAGGVGCLKEGIINADQLQKNEAFFQDFFKPGGNYLQDIVSSTDQISGRVTVGKRYKAHMDISVNHKGLRDLLEKQGIVRGLSSGF